MSVSSEVRRTLVKSPPELWAELSDPVSLARHLGEFGEIRIVRTEPDRAVAWEAAADDGAQTSGRVEIEPSGWGTKVTLTATRTVVPVVPVAPEAEAEHEQVVEPPSELEAEVEATPAFAQPAVEPESDPEPAAALESEPEPAPRQGYFARLFRRRRRDHAQPETPIEPEPAVEPPFEPELDVEPEPEPEPPEAVEIAEPAVEEPAPEVDIAAELVELEEQTTAVLAGVLDRLGAAHHRPFSRA
ncbi:MAG TPA: hypothetical protein VES65_05655 [Solirubrobacteraceae bacterium]|nr:hypothetical protein [Solirubrobacteraceae bacterium]